MNLKLSMPLGLLLFGAATFISNPVFGQAKAPAADDESVKRITLDETFGEYHPADSGRALVFYLPKAKQIVVYDTVSAKLRGSIKISSNDIRFACTKDAIHVALVDQGMIQSYALATLERGKAFPIPDKLTLKDIGAGNASAGPLWINTGERLVPISTTTGQPLQAKGELPTGKFSFRVSADGNTVISWGPNQHFLATQLRGETLTAISSVETSPKGNRRYMVNADGGFFFYESKIYDALTRPVPTVKPYTNMIPCNDPRFFIAVKGTQENAKDIAICSVGDRKILAEINDVGNLGGWTAMGDVPRVAVVSDAPAGNGEARVVFLPNEKAIASIVVGNKEFQVRTFDLDATLGKDDFLYVDSNPQLEVAPGKSFQYKPHVNSKRGGLKYEIQTGPEGLIVAADGKINWNVPSAFTGTAAVIVSISDASNQVVYHSFTLAGPAPSKTQVATKTTPPAPATPSRTTPTVGGNIGRRPPAVDDTRIIGGVQTMIVAREAVTGDRAKGDPPKIRTISSVRGMVVSRAADGDYHGKAVDIIAVAPRDAKGLITVRGSVGKEMRVSLDEAMRLVELKREDFDRASIDLSFGDKYSTKDGGSAGTAFALLLLSALGEFELNPDAAVTGDITIDSKVRTVGEVPAKAHGAALDKVKIVAIPEGNISEFEDTMLLYGAPAFWEVQIFSVKTLDDAIGVMRKDPDAKIIEAMKLFDKLKVDHSAKAPSILAQSPNKEVLDKILELAPNHLSAKNLQLIANAKAPKTLSPIGTVREAMRSMGPMRDALIDAEPHPELAKNGSIAKVRQALEKVSRIADKAATPVVKALDEFCVAYLSWSVIATDPKSSRADKERAITTLDQKGKAIDSAMDAVIRDKDVIEKLMRE